MAARSVAFFVSVPDAEIRPLLACELSNRVIVPLKSTADVEEVPVAGSNTPTDRPGIAPACTICLKVDDGRRSCPRRQKQRHGGEASELYNPFQHASFLSFEKSTSPRADLCAGSASLPFRPPFNRARPLPLASSARG